jgi:hypothetical protein
MKKIIVFFAACMIALSAMGQSKVHVGIDASTDCFLPANSRRCLSFGLGVRTRLGEYDQWMNLVGGLRYIYGPRLSGFQIPVLLNVNLLKGEQLTGYLGGGFEFDFIGTYWGSMKVQAGLAYRNFDFRVFYKAYQGDLGAGLTYYF